MDCTLLNEIQLNNTYIETDVFVVLLTKLLPYIAPSSSTDEGKSIKINQ